jgi:hypothetical protein
MNIPNLIVPIIESYANIQNLQYMHSSNSQDGLLFVPVDWKASQDSTSLLFTPNTVNQETIENETNTYYLHKSSIMDVYFLSKTLESQDLILAYIPNTETSYKTRMWTKEKSPVRVECVLNNETQRLIPTVLR